MSVKHDLLFARYSTKFHIMKGKVLDIVHEVMLENSSKCMDDEEDRGDFLVAVAEKLKIVEEI